MKTNQIIEALEAAEWQPSEIDGELGCPCCRNSQIEGHENDCLLACSLSSLKSGELVCVDGDEIRLLQKIADEAKVSWDKGRLNLEAIPLKNLLTDHIDMLVRKKVYSHQGNGGHQKARTIQESMGEDIYGETYHDHE